MTHRSKHFVRDSLAALTRDVMERDLSQAMLGDAGEWSLQGFGMFRKYLAGGKFRLHVWDSRYRVVPDVTMLHDHPWDFDSLVVAGRLEQHRYRLVPDPAELGAVPYLEQSIVCGPGGHACETPVPVYLLRLPRETVEAGDAYTQLACEVHESLPVDGTVTLVERTFHENTEVAHVYYPVGGAWVSAEPRPAHPEELAEALAHSLATWFAPRDEGRERETLYVGEAPC